VTKPKVSRKDAFKIKVLKKSPDRVFWAKGKAAVEKKIDLKALKPKGGNKESLGDELDRLYTTAVAGMEVKKVWGGKLEPEELKVVQTQGAKVKAIVTTYRAICDKNEKDASLTDDQRSAWRKLDGTLSVLESVPNEYVNKLKA
jgi:hypothetical protein